MSTLRHMRRTIFRGLASSVEKAKHAGDMLVAEHRLLKAMTEELSQQGAMLESLLKKMGEFEARTAPEKKTAGGVILPK